MPQQAYKLSARTPATVRRPLSVVPLLLLLLFLCCASVCVAWDDGSVQSAGVVRELPRTGQSGVQAYTVATKEDWKLIRIVASTKDLEDDKKYCTEVGQVVVGFGGNEATCYERDVLDTKKKDEYINKIIPAAIKLHMDRLRVEPRNGNLIVPKFEDDSFCEYFTVPPEHSKEGVDADFVLYVAAIPWHWPLGHPCATAEPSGRPIASVMNFIPHLYGGLRLNVRRAAHEIAHALGLDIYQMEAKKMLSVVSIRGKNRTVVSYNLTREKAQAHYGCSKLEGMQLELDYNNEVISHWLLRVAKDELMADPLYGGAGYYTALTMATFEGLGYYKANWGMEEPMSWGKESGCEFLNENCKKDNKPLSPELFCEDNTVRCSSDRSAYGTCYLPPVWSRPSPNDICNVIGSSIIRDKKTKISSYCTGSETDVLPGSLMGPDSWCLDGEGLQLKNGKSEHTGKEVSGVCALVLCDEKNHKVSVKYKGSTEDKWHDCSEVTSISVQSSEFEDGGKIKCPKYSEVCTIASNGSSLVQFGVKPPAAPGGSTSSGSSGNTIKEGSQIGKDGTLSADCSLPIVLLLVVLAVVMPC